MKTNFTVHYIELCFNLPKSNYYFSRNTSKQIAEYQNVGIKNNLGYFEIHELSAQFQIQCNFLFHSLFSSALRIWYSHRCHIKVERRNDGGLSLFAIRQRRVRRNTVPYVVPLLVQSHGRQAPL